MIVFEKIRWKNFLSTGDNFTEVILDQHVSTLIIGTNGAGKSTILDALTFVLFNKPHRKINKTALVNSVNNKDCVVEIEFRANNKFYKVVRGMKPAKFQIFCDGILLNQNADSRDYQEVLSKSILKMIAKSFTSIVILGSATHTPFMQLGAPDKRAVVEDMLDIGAFSIMNVLNKAKLNKNKEDTEKIRLQIKMLTQQQEFVTKTLASLRVDNDAKIRQIKGAMRKVEKEKEVLVYENEQTQKLIDGMDADLDDKINNLYTTHTELANRLSSLKGDLKRAEKESKFISENDDCPTCHQPIDTNFKLDRLKTLDIECLGNVSEMEGIQNSIQNITNEINGLTTVRDQKKTYLNEIQTNQKLIRSADQEIKRLLDTYQKLKSETGTVEDTLKEKEKVDGELLVLNDSLAKLLDERQYIECAHVLLKDDGIKTRINKQYLPIINKYINKYLTQLGFFVKVELDENFQETIKSRHLDEFSYNNFSEGEKLRIDLAILFTWRDIAKMRNSVNVNILFMDEILDRSLDGDGMEEFTKMMWGLNGTDTNFYVISHRENIPDKFERVLRFDKKKGFSSLTT